MLWNCLLVLLFEKVSVGSEMTFVILKRENSVNCESSLFLEGWWAGVVSLVNPNGLPSIRTSPKGS